MDVLSGMESDLVIRVIKTEAEYEAALALVERLMDERPAPGSPDAERLELLSVLVEDYEAKTLPHEYPDPIEAIRFRMEQQGLRQKDLVPYIGSASKVSEVLSGKRPLTLSMIRALHSGLGIPADVLLQGQGGNDVNDLDLSWESFPISEMAKRGWISTVDIKRRGEALLREFFNPIGGPQAALALYRKGQTMRSERPVDYYALSAWTARVMHRAMASPPQDPYVEGCVTPELMSEVAKLSWFEQGPRLACEFLARYGIAVVIEPHLPKTHVDGAALLTRDRTPVIGLTVRHDRLDNFWFSLMHELAHIRLHLGSGTLGDTTQFFDDFDVAVGSDPREVEADAVADEALIPEAEWVASPASKVRAAVAVELLARKLRIHPAIVAGRIRYRYNDYRVLGDLVGQGRVRLLFPEVTWG
jgi:HTH-type transcriptional regulator / antitoxin HigA